MARLGKFCGGGGWACWIDPRVTGYYSTHGSHKDLARGYLIFIPGAWAGLNSQYRKYLPAHEWGHNMSLADHETVSCAPDTIMVNYTNGTPPQYPCKTAPTAADLTTVRCTVYSRCPTHNEFQTYLLQNKASVLPQTSSLWDFTTADYNNGGKTDVMGIL